MKKQRKYSFMDYSKLLDLAKKIKRFLDKSFADENADDHFEFPYQLLGRAIRKPLHKKPVTHKDPTGQLKYSRNSLINPQVLTTVQKAFNILQDLDYLKAFNFEHVPKQDSYIIQVEKGAETGAFDTVVKHSQYFPVVGEKQILTDALRSLIEQSYQPDYQNLMTALSSADYATQVSHLSKVLPDIWLANYKAMTKLPTNVYEMPRDFTFMFDLQSQNPNPPEQRQEKGQVDDFIEDRVVVTWGLSKKSIIKRDAVRMAGYLRGVFEWTDKNTDKGHFIGHSLGGSVDENLFPQRKDINRGHSARGKTYRAMEQYCADNPGTFCFSRPIYADFSTRPFMLEYGVLKQDGNLWVEHFDNV